MAANVELILQRIQQDRFMELPPAAGYPDIEEVFPDYKASSASLVVKRLFDLVLTIPMLVLSLPLLAVCYVLIRIDSPGPVIFKQKRVGIQGRLFNIYKFRTMRAGTEFLGKYFIAENDDCITRIGRILRKFKIDELPQLFNVLKGDMSLVGPRPMIPQIVARYPAGIKKIVLSVPPGITGLDSIAYIDENEQLSAAANPEYLYDKHILPIKINYYIYYVFAHNIWLDFKIILLTLVFLARRINDLFKKRQPRLPEI